MVEYEVESEEEVSEDSTSGSETDEGEDALVPRDWVPIPIKSTDEFGGRYSHSNKCGEMLVN